MKWLFEKCARKWGHESARRHEWRGLALYGVDGTTVRVPDSLENRAFFGSQDAGAGRGVSGYPLARIVSMMALRSHILVAAKFGPYGDERPYARELWSELPDNSLAIVDRNIVRDFSVRHCSHPLSMRNDFPPTNFASCTTSDGNEFGFDEVKTDLLDRQEAIRSKTPKGVLQELWAIGLAYNLVRLEMERIAEEAEVVPNRVSFIMSLRLIRANGCGPQRAARPALPRRVSDGCAKN